MMKIINISPTNIEDEINDHWQCNCIYLATKKKNDKRYVNYTATVITAAISIRKMMTTKYNSQEQPRLEQYYFLRGT